MYIRENVTFSRLERIEKAEVKCTFSNGREAIFNFPNIIEGSFIHKGDIIIQELASSSPSLLSNQERANEYVQFNFPIYFNCDGILYTCEEI